MTDPDIAQRRLHTQGLSAAPFTSPEAVVGWLGAMQSQEYALAKWSVGQRVGGSRASAIDRALAAGTILRTHILRPTWHYVLPGDIRWMQALTGPRVRALNAPTERSLELDEAVISKSHALIEAALRDGNHLTRKELGACLNAGGIVADGRRLGYLMMRAELDALICSGTPKGKQQTYALLDERAPQTPSLPRDEALAELTRRYFTSHGPATMKDFRWWSGLTAADARRGLDVARSHLASIEVNERTYWFGDTPAPPDAAPRAHLLQIYDESIVAYTESRSVIDVAGLARPIPHKEVWSMHALLLDGQIAGFWRRVLTAQAVTVEVRPLRPFDAAERAALTDAVERYGRFLNLPAAWRSTRPGVLPDPQPT